jgi:hypothetical protein
LRSLPLYVKILCDTATLNGGGGGGGGGGDLCCFNRSYCCPPSELGFITSTSI